ncbi:TetR family transcriptional regulator [Actinoallomurus purpureus]|uniref:TetR/AcrR family transcriptional regulator n=1 Tax=Actinoallomurus purpureus TaxID=478114 RepID=UPI0020936E7A|nr:TetR family transcriptional regulator [Actinoallomurus purpureus]MCO6004978.1 TetR family transcriptional regulator [Actinoallomurus purpureus]
MEETGRPPRRTPAAEERKLDAERSRRLLLDAALEEFAAKGYAGARVQDIADRAGVNKQLISYYFGGKQGLYECLKRQWLEREAEFNRPDIPFDELIVRYLEATLADPRGTRLLTWQGLADTDAPAWEDDLADIRQRQARGDIGDDLDPGVVLLLCLAAVSAPVVMPQKVRGILGLEPDSEEFRELYTEQLRRIMRRLA